MENQMPGTPCRLISFRPRPLALAGSAAAAALFLWSGHVLGGVLLGAALAAVSCVSIRDADGALWFAACAVSPAVAYAVMAFCDNGSWAGSAGRHMMNLSLCGAVWLLALAVSGKPAAASRISCGAALAFGAACRYVESFRGYTLLPRDVLYIGTALNVAGGYDFAPEDPVLAGAAVCAAYLCASGMFRRDIAAGKAGPKARAGSAALAAAFLAWFFLIGPPGMAPYYWNSGDNGLLLNFMLAARESAPGPPDGYDGAGTLLDGLSWAYPSDAASSDGLPDHVIAVMCESFAEPGSGSGIPFASFPCLDDIDGIRGWAYPSAFGGMTPNSEFEFLTGSTMRFLPDRYVPYMSCLRGRDGFPCLVSQLSSLGYDAAAVHPFRADSWNRPEAYRALGFREFYDVGSFEGYGRVRPGMAGDGIVSDADLYDWLLKMLDGGPSFTFAVTIQNHGAYLYGMDGMEHGASEELETYRACVGASAAALAGFLADLEERDDSVLVIFFGDHAPEFALGSYEDRLGMDVPSMSGTELEEAHRTPFLVWMNHGGLDGHPDLGACPRMSLDYLAGYALRAAGMPMTGCQKYLEELRREYPVVNIPGAMGPDMSAVDEAGLADYKIVQHAHCFGEPELSGHPFFCLRASE